MNARFLALALVAMLGACGKKEPEPVPSPEPDRPATPPPAPPPPPPPPATGNPDDAAAAAAAERTRLLQVLQQPVYFDYDRDEIRSGADQAALDSKAAILLANPGVQVQISGHADERGSDEYNLVLGNRRAASVKQYLESKGVDGARIRTLSFGEERPADSGGTEEAFAKNRRAEFEVSGAERLVAPR